MFLWLHRNISTLYLLFTSILSALTPSMPISISPSSLFQYLIILVLAFVLLGNPLLTLLGGGSNEGSTRRARTVVDDDVDVVPMSQEKLKSLVIPEEGLHCEEPGYRVRVFQRRPLVVYIERFLSVKEREEVMEISEPLYLPSTTSTLNTTTLNPSIRQSLRAQPPRSPTIKCIESRAQNFQGPRPYTYVEKLWAQKYSPGGHYSLHYDWGSASRSMGRISSFMVFVKAPEEGGGTWFPRLRGVERGSGWCAFVECEEGEEKREGVTWKPIAGNAVYWENFDEVTGEGFEESWHAGLPVVKGEKVGLNIWSWYQKGFRPDGSVTGEASAGEEGVGEKGEL